MNKREMLQAFKYSKNQDELENYIDSCTETDYSIKEDVELCDLLEDLHKYYLNYSYDKKDIATATKLVNNFDKQYLEKENQ